MNQLFKIFITCIALYICIKQINIHELPYKINQISIQYVIPIFISIFFHLYFLSKRWFNLNTLIKVTQKKSQIFKATFYGYALNQVLPTSIGGDGYRFFVIKKLKNSINKSIHSVFLDRVFGLYFLMVLVLLSSIFLIKLNPIFFIITFTIFFILFGSFFISKYRVIKKIKWLSFFDQINFDLNQVIFSKSSKIVIPYSLISKFFNILIFLFVLLLLNITISWQIIMMVPCILLFGYLPLSFAGWGLREGVTVLLFSYLSIDFTTSFLISFIFGFLQLIFGVSIFIFYLLNDFKK